METSKCIEQIGEDRYRCRNRGIVIVTDTLPIHCGLCENNRERLAVLRVTSCSMASITGKLTVPGATRLQRCREAKCGMIHPIKKDCGGLMDQLVCVGRGNSKEWMVNWSEFLNGEESCPHWPDDGHTATS